MVLYCVNNLLKKLVLKSKEKINVEGFASCIVYM